MGNECVFLIILPQGRLSPFITFQFNHIARKSHTLSKDRTNLNSLKYIHPHIIAVETNWLCQLDIVKL